MATEPDLDATMPTIVSVFRLVNQLLFYQLQMATEPDQDAPMPTIASVFRLANQIRPDSVNSFEKNPS